MGSSRGSAGSTHPQACRGQRALRTTVPLVALNWKGREPFAAGGELDASSCEQQQQRQ
jgi:hypothetical protein